MLEISVRQYNKYLDDKQPKFNGKHGSSCNGDAAAKKVAGVTGGKALTPLSWARVLDPLDTIMGRMDASLQALSSFLHYAPIAQDAAGNAAAGHNYGHAVMAFTGQWPGEAVEEGTLPVCLLAKPSYESLEVRNAVNTVLVNLEKLVHAVGALCAYALNVDVDEAETEKWAVAAISHLNAFLDTFQVWAHRVYTSLDIEGGRFSVDVTKFCILTMPALLYVDVTSELLSAQEGLPASLLVSGLLEKGCVSHSSFCRVVTSTARKATMKYYAKCRGMVQLEEYWPSALLSFLSWHLKSRGEKEHGIHVDVAPRSTDLTCFPTWCAEDANRKQFAKVMGADLSTLLSKIINRRKGNN